MLRQVKEADWQRAEHEQAANENKLILLLESILHCVVNYQWRYDEEENEVDEDQNRSDPLPVDFNSIK